MRRPDRYQSSINRRTWHKVLFLVLMVSNYHGVIYSQPSAVLNLMPDTFSKIVLMAPTGETVDGLPEMYILEDTTELYRTVNSTFNNSFISQTVDLYFIAQVYLKNIGKKKSIEPAYLALTNNQGGFAKFGFVLLLEGKHSKKPESPYIDITVSQATSPPDKLMSITQLYPHEMGHVLIHLLSKEDTLASNTRNVDMHFFSLITDYSTAFNEGFAEHIENVSRTFEKNEDIKLGIQKDVEQIENNSALSIKGFESDFVYPFRLGFYKASMLNWYQKYEDYKRYTHVFNGDIKFNNKTIHSGDIEDRLTFRNAGVGIQPNNPRNLVQLYATEGAISAFFTHLSTSNLGQRYLDSTFYLPFIYDKEGVDLSNPENVFTPIQNQFIKYYFVIQKYVTFNNSSSAQIVDFIDGYIQEFPSEEKELLSIFQNALGREYSNDLPPPIWFLVKDHPHRLLAFDPFDAITLPIYTFDLNMAEVEDLLTIKGMTKEAARAIINYRDTNGLFMDLAELQHIPGVPEELIDNIHSSQFDNTFFEESIESFNLNLSINTLLFSTLGYVFGRAILYFLFLAVVVYFILPGKKTLTPKQSIILVGRYLLLWLVFVLVGLSTVFLIPDKRFLPVLTLFLLTVISTIILYRNRKSERKRTLIVSGVMTILIVLSVV